MHHPMHMGEKHEEFHEIRFRGALLSHHESKEAAEKHLATHYKDHMEHPHHDFKKEFTIGPKKPVEIYCRGNFFETCDSEEEAEKIIAKVLEAQAENASLREPSGREHFEVVNRPAGQVQSSEIPCHFEVHRSGAWLASFATREAAIDFVENHRNELVGGTPERFRSQLSLDYELIDRSVGEKPRVQLEQEAKEKWLAEEKLGQYSGLLKQFYFAHADGSLSNEQETEFADALEKMRIELSPEQQAQAVKEIRQIELAALEKLEDEAVGSTDESITALESPAAKSLLPAPDDESTLVMTQEKVNARIEADRQKQQEEEGSLGEDEGPVF